VIAPGQHDAPARLLRGAPIITLFRKLQIAGIMCSMNSTRIALMTVVLSVAPCSFGAEGGVPPPKPASERPTRRTAPFTSPLSRTDTALDIYEELTGLTVLRPAAMPQLPADLVTKLSQTTNEAVSLIEAELKKSRFEILRKANLFAVVVPVGFTNIPPGKRLESLIPPANSVNQPASAPAAEDRLPAGTVNFANTDLNIVLAIYGELENRTILRPVALFCPPVRFRTQKALSKAQVIYGFKLLLALNGIAVIEDGPHFVEVVPFNQLSQVKPHAPKAEESERLIDPKRVPTFTWTPGSPRIPPPPASAQTRVSNELARIYVEGRTKLGLPPAAPPKPVAGDLAEYYAKVSGLSFIRTNQLDNTSVIFALRTPVTKAELLYAIETTFDLNNLALVPVGNKAIRVGHISERKPAAER